MRIAVLGTGKVGRALASRLACLGHDVVIGTRDVEKTQGTASIQGRSGEFADWHRANPKIRLANLPEAAAFGELILNAINGVNSLAALTSVGEDNLAGKVLLDLALPLELSAGLPPTLPIANTDSLGEQIQRMFPSARVVKSLNTVHYQVMIDPNRIPGEHSIFVAGNDTDAKALVTRVLAEFGWAEESIVDLGRIDAARGVEMYSRLFFALHDVFHTFDFNIKVVRDS